VRVRAPACAALFLAACGGGSSGHDAPIAATLFENLLVVPTMVNGKGAPMLAVDTGSPVVVIAPDSTIGVASGVSRVDSLQVGAHAFSNVQVVGDDIFPGLTIRGLLGCTVICRQGAAFNYRDRQLVIGSPAVPHDVADPGVVLSFGLDGGQTLMSGGQSVTFPPSRVSIDANIEGTTHPMFVDTGAYAVLIRTTVFDQLVMDGRKTLTMPVFSAAGRSDARLARAHQVSVGAATVMSPIISAGPSIDTLLDSVSNEVSHNVDGVVGASFLTGFFVYIDYPSKQLHLQEYATRDHVIDLAIRVGFFTSLPSNGQLTVSEVVAGSDADKKGVRAGDTITSVDGMSVSAFSAEDLIEKFTGRVGSTHTVDFGAQGTKTIAVEDLLAS
jgi:hypothetical protein